MRRNELPRSENLRKVERVVTDINLFHLYLACGHLISQPKSDFNGRAPSEVECWACAQEKNEL
jgi:hypothetical protein